MFQFCEREINLHINNNNDDDNNNNNNFKKKSLHCFNFGKVNMIK